MLIFDVSVSGSQVGRALTNDPQEMAYALAEIMEICGEDLSDLAANLVVDGPYGLEGTLPAFLRKLADEIEATQ